MGEERGLDKGKDCRIRGKERRIGNRIREEIGRLQNQLGGGGVAILGRDKEDVGILDRIR